MAHVLVVDDLRNVRQVLAMQLVEAGHQVVEADGGRAALAALERGVYDLVITDLRLGDLTGLEVLRAAKRLSPATEVLVLTAYGTLESGIAAMKAGAYDYLTKPVKPEEMSLVVAQALEKRRLGDRVARLQERGALSLHHGVSRAWRELVEAASRVAETEATVLITGESGTGKEVVASLIHGLSRRKGNPLHAINLGALPESLQESELFGHVRGSFTGAVAARKGIFMEADGGTLFLDELGEAAPSTQVAMLRVLALGELRPVGGDRDVKVNVRVLAATNADLEAAVREGTFREDLFFRINVFPVRVPALRERVDDIPGLARHLLGRLAARMNRAAPEFTDDALVALKAYSWPGNVRELENVIERTLILVSGPQLQAEDLRLVERPAGRRGEQAVRSSRTLADLEREHVLAVVDEFHGQRLKAAQALGISRATLFRKLREYGIQGLDESN